MIEVKNSTKNNLTHLVNHNDPHFECRTRLFKTILLLALTQHPFGFHDERFKIKIDSLKDVTLKVMFVFHYRKQIIHDNFLNQVIKSVFLRAQMQFLLLLLLLLLLLASRDEPFEMSSGIFYIEKCSSSVYLWVGYNDHNISVGCKCVYESCKP